jgi:uncharacterized protein (TIGR02145 family)
MKNVFFNIRLLFSLCMVAISLSSFDTLSIPESVEINGVHWATRNVDQSGTFAARPEDPGMFYQWNRNKAWTATDSVTGWDSSVPIGDSWEETNDPSPAGYRVPTLTEIKTLFDLDKVSNEWITINGINGRKFTDNATGKSIFLPAVGDRDNLNNGMLCDSGINGQYWSSAMSKIISDTAYYLYVSSGYAAWYYNHRSYGRSVRPVVETANITILLYNNGIFLSEDVVTGSITSSEEDLTEVAVLKDDGEVVATITSFNSLPVLKEDNGVYAVLLSDLTEGSYVLRAKSKTSINFAKFELVKTVVEDIPESVEINGVRWATCNVDDPGTFAANPESPGMFYQWNRKKAWSATGCVTGWDTRIPAGDSWEKENDPSPDGYRVPTLAEIETLLDTDKVSNKWTTQKGVNGRKFTDKTTGNSIFLPAVGNRSGSDGELYNDGVYGFYWSSTAYEDYEDYASYLYFVSSYASWNYYLRGHDLSVRPVAE